MQQDPRVDQVVGAYNPDNRQSYASAADTVVTDVSAGTKVPEFKGLPPGVRDSNAYTVISTDTKHQDDALANYNANYNPVGAKPMKAKDGRAKEQAAQIGMKVVYENKASKQKLQKEIDSAERMMKFVRVSIALVAVIAVAFLVLAFL